MASYETSNERDARIAAEKKAAAKAAAAAAKAAADGPQTGPALNLSTGTDTAERMRASGRGVVTELDLIAADTRLATLANDLAAAVPGSPLSADLSAIRAAIVALRGPNIDTSSVQALLAKLSTNLAAQPVTARFVTEVDAVKAAISARVHRHRTDACPLWADGRHEFVPGGMKGPNADQFMAMPNTLDTVTIKACICGAIVNLKPPVVVDPAVPAISVTVGETNVDGNVEVSASFVSRVPVTASDDERLTAVKASAAAVVEEARVQLAASPNPVIPPVGTQPTDAQVAAARAVGLTDAQLAQVRAGTTVTPALTTAQAEALGRFGTGPFPGANPTEAQISAARARGLTDAQVAQIRAGTPVSPLLTVPQMEALGMQPPVPFPGAIVSGRALTPDQVDAVTALISSGKLDITQTQFNQLQAGETVSPALTTAQLNALGNPPVGASLNSRR